MGFFTNIGQKIRNLIQRKGWKDDETIRKEEEEIIQKQPVQKKKVVEVEEPEKIPEKEIEEREINEEQKEQEKVEEKETAKALQGMRREELTETGQDIIDKSMERADKEFASLKRYEGAPSIEMINTAVDKALQETQSYNESYLQTDIIPGESYGNLMKNAILNSGTKIDNQIADLIVMNSDKFRYRFTSTLNILVEDEGEEKNVILPCYGTTPKDLGIIMEEEEFSNIREGRIVDVSKELYELINTITARLRSGEEGISVGNPNRPSMKSNQVTIKNITIGTRFR